MIRVSSLRAEPKVKIVSNKVEAMAHFPAATISPLAIKHDM